MPAARVARGRTQASLGHAEREDIAGRAWKNYSRCPAPPRPRDAKCTGFRLHEVRAPRKVAQGDQGTAMKAGSSVSPFGPTCIYRKALDRTHSSPARGEAARLNHSGRKGAQSAPGAIAYASHARRRRDAACVTQMHGAHPMAQADGHETGRRNSCIQHSIT